VYSIHFSKHNLISSPTHAQMIALGNVSRYNAPAQSRFHTAADLPF
jgi:hypothetical protein